jgi:hypothetical protein
VFDIDGRINMQWLHDVFELNNDEELAEQFYDHLKGVDNSAWFYVMPLIEDATGTAEYHLEITGLVAT